MFLWHALNAGWEVTGLEPSETLSAQAIQNLGGKGDIQCATLENARLRGGFDALTLWDVLEHVTYPVEFLRACSTLLRPGGMLFLTVPDLDSLEARLLGRRWPLLLPEHLNYFTRGSLRRCGQSVGLTLIGFGRRRVYFSVKYVSYRLAQHHIPGAAILHQLTSGAFGRTMIPLSLGETYAVWRR